MRAAASRESVADPEIRHSIQKPSVACVRTPPLAGKFARIGNFGHEWTLNNFLGSGQRATANGLMALRH